MYMYKCDVYRKFKGISELMKMRSEKINSIFICIDETHIFKVFIEIVIKLEIFNEKYNQLIFVLVKQVKCVNYLFHQFM